MSFDIFSPCLRHPSRWPRGGGKARREVTTVSVSFHLLCLWDLKRLLGLSPSACSFARQLFWSRSRTFSGWNWREALGKHANALNIHCRSPTTRAFQQTSKAKRWGRRKKSEKWASSSTSTSRRSMSTMAPALMTMTIMKLINDTSSLSESHMTAFEWVTLDFVFFSLQLRRVRGLLDTLTRGMNGAGMNETREPQKSDQLIQLKAATYATSKKFARESFHRFQLRSLKNHWPLAIAHRTRGTLIETKKKRNWNAINERLCVCVLTPLELTPNEPL